jgi:hypothetical protein
VESKKNKMENIFILRNDTLGIDENDVASCMDKEILLLWQSEVNKELSLLSCKIGEIKAKSYIDKTYINSLPFSFAKMLFKEKMMKVQQLN